MTPQHEQFKDFLSHSIKGTLDLLIESEVFVSIVSTTNPVTVKECFQNRDEIIITVSAQYNYFMETHILLATMFKVDGDEPHIGFAFNEDKSITYRVSWN